MNPSRSDQKFGDCIYASLPEIHENNSDFLLKGYTMEECKFLFWIVKPILCWAHDSIHYLSTFTEP
jgi:hypothetical protein